MNLKYITNSRIPTHRANGVQIMLMSSAFSKYVDKVELIVPNRINEIKKNPFLYYKIKKSFNIKHIFCIDTIIFIKDYYPEFIKNILFRIQWFSFGISSLRYIFSKDIIYTRDEFVVVLLSLFSKKCNYEVHRLPDSFDFFYKFIFNRCKSIITINSHLKKAIKNKYGVRSENIFVAHDAINELDFNINISKTQVKKKLGLDLNKIHIFYIGALEGWKGHDTLLKSSNSLPGNFEIVIVGGEKNQIKELKLKYPKVKFLGFKPYFDLPINQKGADILVIPNSAKHKISKYYTSPLKLFAHMKSQRPIICSDLPSMRDIVNEDDVLFFKPDSEIDLTNKIIELSKDIDFQNLLINSCLKKVKNYTWNKRAKEIIGFLNR